MKEFKLVKARAKTEIIIKPDRDDDWFIYVIHVEKKSGKESSKSMIIEKDLHEHLSSLYEKGWVDFDPKAEVKKVKSKKK